MIPRSLFFSIRHAAAGLWFAIRQERNMQIEISAFLVMLFLAIFFEVTRFEFLLLILTSVFVLVLELINSAVEYMLDLMKPRLSDRIARCKDMAAAAVLLASLLALVVGIVIFLPYVVHYLTA